MTSRILSSTMHLNLKRACHLLALTVLLLQIEGCAVINSKRNVHITPTTTAAKISVLNKSEQYEPQDTGNVVFRASAKFPLVIKQEKEGYRTSVHVYLPEKLYVWKAVDLAATCILNIFAISNLVESGKSSDAGLTDLAETQIAVGLASLLVAGYLPWYGPFTHHCSQIVLPEMKRLPVRDSSERYMIVDQVKINIDEKNQTYTHYKSFSKFKKGKSNYTSKNREGFQCKSSIIKHDLNAILSEVNYIDTSNTIFKNSYNSVKINTEIVSVETYGITLAGSYIKLKARLSLHEFGSEKELYTREIESTSEYDEFPTESSFCSLTASALKNILYEFLEDEGVRPFLKSQEEQYAQSFQEMDTLNISNADFARNKQEALNAVVTIQKGNSHGSGCIISSDGYIISNLHVTSDDDTQLKVILEGGEERTCRFIRSNPVYDLVLLKIDPVSIKPLKVNSSREISIGEVVFAIGTPADIELGQSITKGIISGKRINNEQVIIQTDVSVNPGNSGGALINSEGELLGVINAKIFGAGIEGLGFAIPAYYIEEALKIEFE